MFAWYVFCKYLNAGHCMIAMDKEGSSKRRGRDRAKRAAKTKANPCMNSCSSSISNAFSVKNLVILTTPSQARPTMITCMQAFSSSLTN